ncbi:G2/mitotic-specific cyclin cdc13, putative [Rhizoctonia solani AG-3 Rhs1AP]|uniref:G2/mitotic-specific cyclin cdc13, putative n=1 Tax=Rhizoctonia solani AG-3 Rhs1AP TaxID=1086054 RepID=X8JJ60_9AGAM|nr:G2/mitotic-specific cyclin cdc13, putative [Rhizoctonia solani AG-3 Rhs1AP]
MNPQDFDECIRLKVEDYQEKSKGLPNATSLQLPDCARLLQILLSTLALEPSDLETCDSRLNASPDLCHDLQLAYNRGTFWELRNHPSLSCFQSKHVDVVTPSSSLRSPRSGFEQQYQGDLPQLFKKVMDEYIGSSHMCSNKRAYNRSITVIQSSGMGKSRLVDELGNLEFTIPINLRGELAQGGNTYPPPDRDVRGYFDNPDTKGDEVLQAEFAVFLAVLFDFIALKVNEIGQGQTGVELAVKWAKYIKDGQNSETVGAHRSKLYADVVQGARNVLRGVPIKSGSPSNPKILKTLFKRMIRSCWRLGKALALGRQLSHKNLCYIYFDGADGLAQPSFSSESGSPCRTNPYDSFGKVLEELSDMPVFFIFLSTNTNLQQFAPVRYNGFPQRRVFPPFTELPFDVFVEEAFKKLDPASLDNVCTTDVMSHFGRPMWFVHHQLWKDQQRVRGPEEPQGEGKCVDHVIPFALEKICPRGAPDEPAVADLAAIGVRIGITFGSETRSSRQMEAKLVESHMRVVYAIPEHREYMHTGTPSEPLLAEAAARRLEQRPGKIIETGPAILAHSFQDGLLELSGQDQLCGRLLVTIAHDIAIQGLLETRLHEPRYHRPIPVLDFLRALFANSHHKTVLDATPVHFNASATSPSEPSTLEEVFKNAYVSFSHFEVAQDSEVLGASLLPYSLIRGCALQAKNSRSSIDAVIPIHMGSITDPITSTTMSAINLQFKYKKNTKHYCVDRSVTVPNVHQPVISIVFELGEEEHPPSALVSGYHASRRETPNGQAHSDDHHYMLIARGHGPETFNAVSEQSKPFYDTILGTRDILYDFPRAQDKGLAAHVENMQPLRSTRIDALLSSFTASS